MDLSEFTFTDFIRIWVRVALVLIFVEAYLTINKIWIRKHERVVSESVSVAAQFLALLTGIPFIGLYIIEGAYEGAISDGVFLIINIIMIAIGIGFWVEGQRSEGFWSNLKKSLRLEKGEAHTLISDFLKPVGAEQVIRILHGLANIDNNLDEKEIQFIKAFADKWDLELDDHIGQRKAGATDEAQSYSELRDMVQDYLRLSPPREQAGNLGDVLLSLANIDGNVSADEQLIIDELSGLIGDYVGKTENTGFLVLIAPQSSAQESTLQEILKDCERMARLGGYVYVVGRYYSQAYAEMVCSWYRDAGYLTINEQRTGNEALQ